MSYKVEILPDAEKTLKKLDKPVRKRIIKFLYEFLPSLDDPRSIGEPLKGKLGEYWKYPRGDFRVICKIEDKKLLILVVE
jgi:mRNA interferase RelE/StbE